MFKKNISDGVGIRNESIYTPLYPPLFWLDNIFKAAKYKRFVLWGIFGPCPSSLGLKQLNTYVMFCEAFLTSPIIIRVKTAKYKRYDLCSGSWWKILDFSMRWIQTSNYISSYCVQTLLFLILLYFCEVFNVFYWVLECVCLNHPFRTPHLWSTDETL